MIHIFFFLATCASLNNGEFGFCSCGKNCSANEGHCYTDNECQTGIFCGSDNCPNYLGFDLEIDCCYEPPVGGENFCSIEKPCGEDQGDCDSDSECQSNLFCGYNNCPILGSEVDCCSKTQFIMSPNYPGSYPSGSSVTWNITAAPFGTLRTLINMQIHEFCVSTTVSTHK